MLTRIYGKGFGKNYVEVPGSPMHNAIVSYSVCRNLYLRQKPLIHWNAISAQPRDAILKADAQKLTSANCVRTRRCAKIGLLVGLAGQYACPS